MSNQPTKQVIEVTIETPDGEEPFGDGQKLNAMLSGIRKLTGTTPNIVRTVVTFELPHSEHDDGVEHKVEISGLDAEVWVQ